MSNYQNGKIYSIRSHQTDKIYVGSTTQSLSKRMSAHRTAYKKYIINNDIYVTSYDILKYDDAYIELIELYPCYSKEELHRREGQIIRATNCVNKCIPGRDRTEYDKQYYQDNKEQIMLQKKQYYVQNKEQKYTYNKQYYDQNKEMINQKITCECGSEIVKQGLSRHKKSKIHLTKMLELESSQDRSVQQENLESHLNQLTI